MSLSTLLQYHDSDEEADENTAAGAFSPPRPPLASVQPSSADAPSLSLPTPSQPPPPSSVTSSAADGVRGEKKRKRQASDTLAFLSSSSAHSSTPLASSPAPAPASGEHELFSLLPPPKREAPPRPPPRSSSTIAPAPPLAFPTSHPPSVPPRTSAPSPAPFPTPHPASVAPPPPPPGMRRPPQADATARSDVHEPSPSEQPHLLPLAPVASQPTPLAFSSAFPPPRIAYSTSSPYAVAPEPLPSSLMGPAASPASLATPWDEPRMLRQFAEVGSIIDVRVDDLTAPPSLPTSLHSTTAASSELKLRTTYWDAKAGKEVVVDGVQGKQKRVHQINALALQAKRDEADILSARSASSNIRRMAKAKYGW